MRYYLDTEFWEHDQSVELISIGIVAEDGREYYAESLDFDWRRVPPKDWLRSNVYPHLMHYASDAKIRPVISQEIKEFVGTKPEFWAYYADYDWVVLCQLFGKMMSLPPTWPMYCLDLKQWMFHRGVKLNALPPQQGRQHNAIDDARWVRDAWDYLQSIARPPA